MSPMHLRLVVATCPLAALVVLAGPVPTASAGTDELRLSFDAGEPLSPGW